jgi:hypothetical protein
VLISYTWQEPPLAPLAPPPLAWLVSTSVDVVEALPAPVHIVHQEPTALLQAINAASCVTTARSALDHLFPWPLMSLVLLSM